MNAYQHVHELIPRFMRSALIALLAVLTACELPGSPDQELNNALQNASRMTDAVNALRLLDRELDHADQDCETTISKSCISTTTINRLVSTKKNFIKSALATDSADAYAYIYNSPRYGDRYQDILAEHVSTLIKLANDADGKQSDSQLLMAAGTVLSKGTLLARDSAGAVNFFARAWAAGSDQSANALAEIYLANNDFYNAYLWSARCIRPCGNSSDLRSDQLRKKLEVEAIINIEQLSSDLTIVELNVPKGEVL